MFSFSFKIVQISRAIAGFFWGTLLSRFRNLPPVDAQ